jgi:uncharacterized membrane protein
MMTNALRMTGWLIMTLLAVVVAYAASRYFWIGPTAAPPPLALVVNERYLLFLLHAGGGSIALLSGAWNMLDVSRRRFLNLHRWLGRVYLIAVLIGGLAGLALATTAQGGLPARVGFAMLAIVWLVTGVLAFIRIRNYDIESHRRWIIRNYALTLAAVTLRLWLPGLMLTGYGFEAVYVTVAWLSWVPNLLIAEIICGKLKAYELATA